MKQNRKIRKTATISPFDSGFFYVKILLAGQRKSIFDLPSVALLYMYVLHFPANCRST